METIVPCFLIFAVAFERFNHEIQCRQPQIIRTFVIQFLSNFASFLYGWIETFLVFIPQNFGVRAGRKLKFLSPSSTQPSFS